jgi:hypothetical protein
LAGEDLTAAEVLALAKAHGVTILPDGDGLELAADREPDAELLDAIAECKAEILAKLREERRQIVQWINANFSSSSPDVCRHCGRGPKPGDAFVRLHCGDDSGVVHQSSCQAWQAAGEAEARRALGLDP